MIGGIYTAASGMAYMIKKYEVLTNNLANIDTPGFKEDYLTSRNTNISFPLDANPIHLPKGIEPEHIITNHNQGKFIQTENGLDVSISGNGYFTLESPEGLRYTRAGNFTIDREGYLVNYSGYKILGEKGPVRVRDRMISIDSSGQIVDAGMIVDKLKIVDFQEKDKLIKEAGVVFQNGGSEVINLNNHDYEVLQGYLEKSNVNIIKTMTEIIEVMRTYESYQKTIQMMDESLHRLNNEVSKV